MTTPTKEELKAALDVIRAMADVIRTLKEVPAGQLYASVCCRMSLAEFERIMALRQRVQELEAAAQLVVSAYGERLTMGRDGYWDDDSTVTQLRAALERGSK